MGAEWQGRTQEMSIVQRVGAPRRLCFLAGLLLALGSTTGAGLAQTDPGPPSAIQKFVDAAKPGPDRYGKKVTVLVGSLPTGQTVQWLSPAIKKIFDIDVEVVRVPIGQLSQAIINDVTTGGNYDVLLFPPRMLGDLVADGHLVNLDAYAKKWDPQLNDVFPAYRELYNYLNGGLYTLTMDGDRLELYYRADLFDNAAEKAAFKAKYNYDLAPPKTWQEYLDVAAFFTRPAGATLAGDTLAQPFFGMSEFTRAPDVADWWLNRFAAFGGTYFDENFKPALNTEAGVKATENLKASLAFGPTGILNFGYPESYDAFIQGRTAMVIQWSDVAKGAENPQASKIVGKVGYAQVPGAAIGGGAIRHRSVLAYSRVFGISAKSKVPEAAYRVIQFLHSPEVSNLYVTGFGGIDAFRLSHYADPANWVAQWPKLPAYIANTKASIENGYPELTIPGAVRYQEALGQQIARALAGETSVKDALAETERQWNIITDELDPKLQAGFWQDQIKVWKRIGLAP